MRKIFKLPVGVLMVLLFVNAGAQDAKPFQLMIDGVKVIVQPSGNELVVIQTVIKGGVQNYPVNKAGIEYVAMSALTECGTAKDPKNSFKNKLDAVTAQVYGYSTMDYASFNLNCIREDLAVVWPLYQDALLTPAFDTAEFRRIRQDQVNIIRAVQSSPDANISQYAMSTAFNGSNYAKSPMGTVEAVSKLTAGETQSYFKKLLTRSRLVIVVVADLDSAAVVSILKPLLDKIPAGVKFEPVKSAYQPVANSFASETRENATNYIQGIAGAPMAGSPDYNAYVLAMNIFAARHFIEVRTKNGLSYAPQSWFSKGNTPYTSIGVSTTEPDKYIAVTRNLIDRIRTEGFTPAELKNEKGSYLTGIFYQQETNEDQAAALARYEVINGNWKKAIEMREQIKMVTLEQLNGAFNKYLTNITWVYQGDTKKVNPLLYTQKATPPVITEKKAF